jgi:hypothetical protein
VKHETLPTAPVDSAEQTELLREILATLRSIDARLADPLLEVVVEIAGRGIAFSTVELIDRATPEQLAVLGRDATRLGRRLKLLEHRGLETIGRDEAGVIWVCTG